MSTRIWLIRFTDRCGTPRATVHTHGVLATTLDAACDIDPAATVEELDALALSDLLAADIRFDQVVADTQAHHRRAAVSYPRIEARMTRELCERYVEAERDRYDAIERCTQPAGPQILKNNADIGEVQA